jgi:putative addiction module component (TIGR02574 family)
MSAKSTLPPTVDALIAAALSLPPAERIRVIDALQGSLEPIDPELEAAHLREIRDRVRALDTGKMECYAIDEVFTEYEER